MWGFGALLSLPVVGIAASQQLPPSESPDRLEQRFERPAVPESKPPIEFPAPERAPPPEKAASIRFVLKDIAIDGTTVYAPDDLKPLYQALIGREISLADVYAVRDAITTRYANDGYILSKAVISAQRVGDGVVHIAVVEGYIHEVLFQGEVTDRFGILADYAERIKAARPLTAAVLERYVMLASDLPGVSVHTVLQPAKDAAAGSDLMVTVDRKPVGAVLSLDDRGTRAIGPYQIDASVELSDVLGQFEQTTVRGIVTPQIDELRYIDVTHVELIGADGATWTIEGRKSWSEPGGAIRQFAVKSQGVTVRTGVSYPLVRSRSETLRVGVDLTYANNRTNAFGDKLSDDRVRYVSLKGSYDIADRWQGSNLFEIGLHHGLDILNATRAGEPGQSQPGAPADFTRLTLSAQRLQPLPEHFGILLATEGQYSADPLPTSEKFGVGGKLYGRAFDSSEITGDRGVSAKIEVQYTPEMNIPHLEYLQYFTYADYGMAWNIASQPPLGRQELASVGAGFRFGLTKTLSGSAEFGKPLLRNATATGSRDMRGFFGLTARY